MKYILVTGGVISSVGKGTISSCVGSIIQGLGLAVTHIKIDPYINVDAGTFSPSEHGEVFVLDDGSEVDLDLGNYERFLSIRLRSANNITTGKIFQKVIEDEREGKYLGRTVQYVPHITDAIADWVMRVAESTIKKDSGEEVKPEICIIELGGIVGDIELMAFVMAFSSLRDEVGPDNFFHIHVTFVLEPSSVGEQKTKPTQESISKVRSYGLSPEILICRSKNILAPKVKEKLSRSSRIREGRIFSLPDMKLYGIPRWFTEQGIAELINDHLRLNLSSIESKKANAVAKWNELDLRTEQCIIRKNIALVGKYVKAADAYASVVKALQHAALSLNVELQISFINSSDLESEAEKELFDEAWKSLKTADGILVPGGFGQRGAEGKIAAIEFARKHNKPFLGICYGFQCAVIEFARNVLNLKAANSTELDPSTPHPVIIDMPEHNQGKMGGTMRLGLKKTIFSSKPSKIKELYGNVASIEERHRHRYEVNPSFVETLHNSGLFFVGKDINGDRMEILELDYHPYFVGVQFHPEFLSRPIKPSPPFYGLIEASISSK